MKASYALSLRLLICFAAVGLTLYGSILSTNDVTAVQLAIPILEKRVKNLQKENERLQYEVDQFENPLHLMELLRKPEFGHLKYPSTTDVIIHES